MNAVAASGFRPAFIRDERSTVGLIHFLRMCLFAAGALLLTAGSFQAAGVPDPGFSQILCSAYALLPVAADDNRSALI